MDFSALHVILELQFKSTGQNVLMHITICALKNHIIGVGKSLMVEVKEMRYSYKELFPVFPILRQVILSWCCLHIQVCFHSYYIFHSLFVLFRSKRLD